MELKIGISYAPQSNPKYRRYGEALERAAAVLDYSIELVDLLEHPSRIAEVDGVLFTGGVDIQPARYGKQSEERLCIDIDENRDRAEFALADDVEARGLPTLGICRGAQLLNVHRGGTLITDLREFGASDHTKVAPETDRQHSVSVTPGSYLSRIIGTRNVSRGTHDAQAAGEINSAHHQAIERPGEGLAVTARAPEDGTAEAIEWADPAGKPFFLAVQWHPERMQYEEPFSSRIFEAFLWEAAAQKMLKSRIGDLGTLRESENSEANGTPSGPVQARNGYDKRSR